MEKNSNMIYIIGLGIFLTVAGIIVTGYGTYIQNRETQDFQDEITDLSKQTKESQDEVFSYSKKNIELSEKLAKQSEESKDELTALSLQNADLTKQLMEMSEDRFRKLTIPSMNVINIEEVLNLGVNSYFKITAKNTGNNDCLDARLLVDRHNSPFAKPGFITIQNFTKVPKDAIVEYKIPIFQSQLIVNIANDSQKEDFSNFLERYKRDETAIVVFFHFEYEWNDETLKSSQYSIIKSNNSKAYGSSSEDFVEPEVKMPKWKK